MSSNSLFYSKERDTKSTESKDGSAYFYRKIYSRIIVAICMDLGTPGNGNLFLKGPDSKYVRFCVPCNLGDNYSTLL